MVGNRGDMVSALTDHVSRFEEPPRRREKRFVFNGKQSNVRGACF